MLKNYDISSAYFELLRVDDVQVNKSVPLSIRAEAYQDGRVTEITYKRLQEEERTITVSANKNGNIQILTPVWFETISCRHVIFHEYHGQQNIYKYVVDEDKVSLQFKGGKVLMYKT